ncbi:hypothetical protein [Brevundimonas sp. SORGH_AS_0993]|uniref:hypothetical protein n=1 Tax=Brevundimonas sp. SORGH_AS_0993 TaxID=3041794 RepID=UPI00278784D7|nr:hypothetical protein [Brevundimonas sp. SORGH_AS_0993]MDQ1153383.1 hypothetical protein [Brevundimonas sp. SORGH_AS_0993]
MKCRIIVWMALSLMVAACSNGGRRVADDADAAEPSAWVQPPHIDGLSRDGQTLIVRGGAGPNARVVLRRANGEAVAGTADAAGRFELRLPALSGDVLFRPEVQVGEDAAVAPETLVIVQGGTGPVALVAAGQPSTRLDAHGLLETVDFDGKALAASGQSSGGLPTVVVDGVRARVWAGGGHAWRAMSSDAGARSLTVDGHVFSLPDLNGGGSLTMRRAGEGWLLTVPVAPKGHQTTWLPDIRP